MTLTLTPNTEARLLALAARRGQTPEAVIDAVIEREAEAEKPAPTGTSPLAPPHLSPTAALFAQWAEEDKTDDPEEIARRIRDGDELLADLQKNRLSLHRIDVSGEEWD